MHIKFPRHQSNDRWDENPIHLIICIAVFDNIPTYVNGLNTEWSIRNYPSYLRMAFLLSPNRRFFLMLNLSTVDNIAWMLKELLKHLHTHGLLLGHIYDANRLTICFYDLLLTTSKYRPKKDMCIWKKAERNMLKNTFEDVNVHKDWCRVFSEGWFSRIFSDQHVRENVYTNMYIWCVLL